MQITSPTALEAVFTNFNVVFLQGRGEASPIAEKLATVQTLRKGREARVIIPGQLARMRKWLGERVVNNLNAADFKFAVDDFEGTVEVDRNDIEDDQLGIYEPQIRDLGTQAGYLWDDLVSDADAAGETTLCYDGQYFYDTDHPVDLNNTGAGTQSNLFAGRALTAANYEYVRTQGASLKGPDGRVMRVRYNALVVGPALEVTAKKIVSSPVLYNGAAPETNPLTGTAEVIVLPEITDSSWRLMSLNNPLKPFVVVKRKEPTLVRKDQANDESVFWRKKFHYGVDARGSATYGPWWLALKAKP